MTKNILLTGGAGFIGSHLADALLRHPEVRLTVIDNFDPFYSKQIKQHNLSGFLNDQRVRFIELDIVDEKSLNEKLKGDFDAIIHLAAKAGVRPSILSPISYQDVNVKGTQNLLEFAKNNQIIQFVFASSSSVYGTNPNYPWKESDTLLQPISPYASTKISAELLGHVYSHLYNIRFIALRFFTVFGPRQRPDLAIHQFAKRLMNDESINFFGDGSSQRDYTYVSDIVAGIISALQYSGSSYEVINLGNNQSVSLQELVSVMEEVFGKKMILNRLPPQPGDVPVTRADISKAQQLLGYSPRVGLREGIERFYEWVRR